MDWPIVGILGTLVLFILAGVAHTASRSPRDRFKELNERFTQGGLQALTETFYVTELIEVSGWTDWRVHHIPDQQVNMGIEDPNGVLYATTNYLDMPFSERVRPILRSGVRTKGTFTLARLRPSRWHRSMQEYAIIDYQPA